MGLAAAAHMSVENWHDSAAHQYKLKPDEEGAHVCFCPACPRPQALRMEDELMGAALGRQFAVMALSSSGPTAPPASAGATAPGADPAGADIPSESAHPSAINWQPVPITTAGQDASAGAASGSAGPAAVAPLAQFSFISNSSSSDRYKVRRIAEFAPGYDCGRYGTCLEQPLALPSRIVPTTRAHPTGSGLGAGSAAGGSDAHVPPPHHRRSHGAGLGHGVRHRAAVRRERHAAAGRCRAACHISCPSCYGCWCCCWHHRPGTGRRCRCRCRQRRPCSCGRRWAHAAAAAHQHVPPAAGDAVRGAQRPPAGGAGADAPAGGADAAAVRTGGHGQF